jgi:hypothetical protein
VGDVSAIERELARTLKTSGSAATPCPLTVEELRELTVEYLYDWDKELSRFPDLVREAHWNLWQWDEPSRVERDSYFVVVVVRPSGLEFLFGYGPQREVRHFADGECPDDVDEVVPELMRRFTVPCGKLSVERVLAEKWAGRGLGLHAE